MNENTTVLHKVFQNAVKGELVTENRIAKVGELILTTNKLDDNYERGKMFKVESHYADIAIVAKKSGEVVLVFHDDYTVIVDVEPCMDFGDMLTWTNRLKEIRCMKSNHLRRQRMRNLKWDFLEAYGWGNGIKQSNDTALINMYATIQSDFFKYV